MVAVFFCTMYPYIHIADSINSNSVVMTHSKMIFSLPTNLANIVAYLVDDRLALAQCIEQLFQVYI